MPISADHEGELPAEIYKAQVDSMFSDVRSLGIGSLAACAAPLVVSIESGLYQVALISLALAVLGGFRLWGMNLYIKRQASIHDLAELRRWEIFYVVGASLHVMLLGAFCLVTFTETEDTFGRLTSFAGAMAYFVGIPGRNFASNLLVNTLILCGAAPMLAALVLAKGHFWLIGIFVLLPFFMAMRNISFRLRGIYLDAVLKARDVSLLADRFDTALNNMPCGLAMLDQKGRVVVTNDRLVELLKLEEEPGDKPVKIEDMLMEASKIGLLDPTQATEIANGLKQRMLGGNFEELLLELTNDRVLSLTLQSMGNGGAVVLFDDVTERNIAQARINELARFDPLTGLPNRVEFRDRAEAILRGVQSPATSAMMFVDLDQFKQVNDTLGHAVGDQLLRIVAERLRACTSRFDLVARLGGDEFVILLKSVKDREEASAAASVIIVELSKPYDIGANHIGLAASIGIAMAAESGVEMGELLRNADMALYQAKADGRGTSRFFEQEMEVKARTRRNLEFDLRQALENDELELYFQPIFNLAKRRYSGCEALLRWKHPTRGMVPPSVFVPIAEEMGLILKLDDWVLRKACLACAAWPQDIRVAVNISAMHFRDPQIVASVQAALNESRLAPHRLEIEITETALLHNIQVTRSILHELRELGVRIALDDFGTGYSSLSYLHTLPLNKIKIDRSFLLGLEQDGRSLKLLNGVTRLSKDLGLLIVMEGVETEEQLELVTKNTSVDEIQGYLFSRPVPRSEIATMFKDGNRTAA